MCAGVCGRFDVSSGSSAMAWWRCDKGHSFPMRIAFRTTREQGRKNAASKAKAVEAWIFCTLKRFSIDFLLALCYIFSSKQYGKLCTMQELLTEYGFRSS